MAPSAHKKSLELMKWVDEPLAGQYIGDVTRIRQVLLNLVSNAVKFTEKGEVLVSVAQGEVIEGRTTLTFSVKDSGMGIPAERLDRLFNSFSQVDASTTRKFGGTGLGLAICKRLVRLMEGEIWVESEEHIGSTFHFTVRLGWEAGMALPLAVSSLADKRILLVDDNPTNLLILHRTLMNWGFNCEQTQLPQEALARLAQQTFDLIILDHHMPGMDGEELAEQIKLKMGEATPPVIILSSGMQSSARKRELGIQACLQKPIREKFLLKGIQQSLQSAPSSKSREDTTQFPQEHIPIPDIRILLVEDNTVNQKVAQKMLAKLGFQAESAWNGAEAVDAAKERQFDLILMDMNMPVMDGIAATRHILRNCLQVGKKRPFIVAMTANVLEEDRKKCFEVGMKDFIAKPVKLQALDELFQKWFPVAVPVSKG